MAANRAELGSFIQARNRQIRRCYLKNFLCSALRRPPCGLTRAAVDGGASTRSCRRHSAHGGHHEPALLDYGGVSLEEARLEVEVPARPRSTQTPAIRWALVTIVGCGAIPDRRSAGADVDAPLAGMAQGEARLDTTGCAPAQRLRYSVLGHPNREREISQGLPEDGLPGHPF